MAPGAGSAGPPDHGYSWIVLAAAVFLHFLAAGNFGTFGLLFIEFVDYFNASKSAVSWIGGIQISLYGISGIFVGPLLKKFGPRPVVVLGCALVTTGFISSRFVNNISLLYLTFGVIPGVGFCCLQMGGVVACQLYFNIKRSFALGIAMTGIGLGAFAWPPLTAWLIGHLSWKGALLVIAAIQLHAFICAALIRPVPPSDVGCPGQITSDCSRVEGPDVDSRPVESSSVEGTRENLQQPSNRYHSKLGEASSERKPHELGELEPLENGTTSLRVKDSVAHHSTKEVSFTFCDKLLLRDPGYWSFMFGQYFEQVGHYLPFTYLPLRGLDIGYNEQASSFLVTCLAISSVSMRILVGFLGDGLGARRVYVTGVAIAGAGAATALSFFCTSYAALAVYGVIFGCISACYAVLQQAVLVDIWGLEKIAVCTGHLFMMSGFGSLTLHPLTGLILDSTGVPAYPFLILGCIQTIGGFLMLSTPFLHKRFAQPALHGETPRPCHVTAELSRSCVSLAM